LNRKHPKRRGAAEPQVARRFPWYFRLIAFLIPIALLALLEAGLRLFGVAAPPPLFIEKDVYGRAFLQLNSQIAARFFHIGPGGVVRPANFQVLPSQKPAGTRRILCLGESTTAGFPFPAHGAFPALLEQILTERQPDQEWEVTNLGVTALSSSSVASFIGEALEVEPDALVLYLGHNEFYGVGGVVSGGARGSAALDPFYRLRLFRLLERAMPPAGSDPEEESRERASVPPDSKMRERAVSNYRKQMETILGAAAKRGVKVVLCEVIANERDLFPFGSPDSLADRQEEAWQAGWESGRTTHEEAVRHLPELDATVQRDSLDAGWRYLRGCAREALGDRDAVDDFIAARNLDAIPFRAPDSINHEIHRLAERYGCTLVPTVEIFRQAIGGGAIGHESCIEHLHPTFLGNARIASAAADALLGRSISEVTPALAGRWLREAALTPVDLAFADARIDKLLGMWPYVRSGDRAAPYPYQARSVLQEAALLFAAAGDSAGIGALQRFLDRDAEIVSLLVNKRLDIQQAHLQLANARVQEQDLASALWEMEAAIRVFPVDHNVWVQLGRVRAAIGDLRGATEAAEQALYWAPGFPPAEELLRDISAASARLSGVAPGE
jgi:lysophospholipase L1-like esterase